MRLHHLTTPRHETAHWPTREMALIDTLVIHHTGAREIVTDTASYLRATARWILRKYGWPAIPYHFAVGQDGAAYQLNDCTKTTYHAGTWHANTTSIGLVLVGNFCHRDPPEAQLETAAALTQLFCRDIKPHSAIVPTACPGRWHRWSHLLTQEATP